MLKYNNILNIFNSYKFQMKPFCLAAVVTLSLITASCGGSAGSGGSDEQFSLTVTALNGTVTVSPEKASYSKGEIVTLSASGSSGYDFSSWEGDAETAESPLKLVMDSNKTLTANFVQFTSEKYYVDYDTGSDTNSGESTDSPWKHAPGDPEATGLPAGIQPGPDTTIFFRGGVVYRGQVKIQGSGSLAHPVTYKGNGWPDGSRAVIDGGTLITGWTKCATAAECGGNANYSSIWYAEIAGSCSPLELNLHEYNTSAAKDEFLWLSQYPAPPDQYFFEDKTGFRTIAQSNFTRTTLTDSGYFTQGNTEYWNDAYIMMWINPNIVLFRKINSFSPVMNQITFDDLGENAIYPDGRDQGYSVYNSIHLISKAGEYCVTGIDNLTGKRRIFLWPRSADNLDSRISMSVRRYGFDLSDHSNITIEGFLIRKFSGDESDGATAIGGHSAAYIRKSNITVKNNIVEHNYKGNSIYLPNAANSSVESNTVNENPKQSGIFISTGTNVTVKNNTIYRSGATSLRLYTVDLGRVTGNTINESRGSHANGMTFYIACNNILIANNKVFNSRSPITFQDSGNLYFINNLVDAGDDPENVILNEWPDTSRGPWSYGTIAILNNTFVRSYKNSAINLSGLNPKNRYYVINNITDGELTDDSVTLQYNLYTGLSWIQQKSAWTAGTGEQVVTDMNSVFTDPAAGDFTLKGGSPAIGAGTDISPYFPSDIITDFDCRTDITGIQRNGWDPGAYTH